MLPVLFSIGPFHVYSFSIFLILSWFIWSFTYWKYMQKEGIDEEFTFGLMFWATILAFFVGRTVFVLSHWALFADTPLRIFTIWIQPGMSLVGALVGGIGAILFLSYQKKLPRSTALDGVVRGFALALLVGLIGALLDGSSVGIQTGGPIGVRYVGYAEYRHPIQLYLWLYVLSSLLFLRLMRKKFHLENPGFFGLWFLFLFTIGSFCIEFVSVRSIYFAHLSLDQWLCITVWAEAVGMLYVRGGGKELVRRIYDTISRRFVRKHTSES